jgi:hypothetical protein
MKKAALPATALVLLAIGLVLIIKPDIVTFATGVPTKAVIIRETDVQRPLTEEWVEFFAGAEKIGVSVWDKDVLGKGKKESPEAKPFLEAVGTQELPALALKWPSGKITVSACPTTLDSLRKAIGK